jgi:PBP1b-binding outer membrane lipoprotein LpoB
MNVFTLSLVTALMITGCVSTQPKAASNKAVSKEKIKQQNTMDLLDQIEEAESEAADEEQELYFADTKGKIFYASGDKNSIEMRVDILLDSLFSDAKPKLPRMGRHDTLNISLEVSRNSIYRKEVVNASQSYVLSNRRYSLVSTDRESLQVLKQVLKQEQDEIYTGGTSISTKQKSDVIVYVESSLNGDVLELAAKMISKNGTILALSSNSVDMNPDTTAVWVSVEVPRSDGPAQTYDVMRLPVSDKDFHGTTLETAVKNVSFTAANDFCQNKMGAQLIAPYVFESARKSLLMSRPASPVDIEIMAPYDEEDDEIYLGDGDSFEAPDGTIVTFHWNNEKYFSVSNLFRSRNATFRCMRAQ